MSTPQFEIIVYGATSFVGQIICRHLVEQYPEGGLSWAAAGRSQSKLDEVLKPLGQEIPTLIANADDEDSLMSIVSQCKVVLSTVGPYALYGEGLVKLCAQNGTDYVDLTGEAQWIRRMITQYEDDAKKSGARIVNCCGFDSIPLDLGNLFLQNIAQEKFAAPATEVKMGVEKAKGGGSGGTIASGLNLYKERAKDPVLKAGLQDPYYLCSSDHGFTAKQRDVVFAEYDEDFKSWVGAFIMAGINTKIVHRTNDINGKAFGEQFKYDEVMLLKDKFMARMAGHMMGFGIFYFIPLLFKITPLIPLIEKIVPQPGEGPSPAAQKAGFFQLAFLGKTDAGERIKVRVSGDRDPGYGATAKMISQAAICLAQDIDKEATGGGFLTPAHAMGNTLIKRLEDHAGMTFEEVKS